MDDDRKRFTVVVYFKDGEAATIRDVVKPVEEKEDGVIYVTTITELVICHGVERHEKKDTR